MADYRKLIPHILKFEGGYAGNIDGKICTMKGVTLEVFQSAFGRHKTCNDLRKITTEQWEFIYKTMFWDRCHGDEIVDQNVANIIVDWCWGSGNSGIRKVQAILGVKTDGIIGRKTLAAINNYPDQKELFNRIKKSRNDFFVNLAKYPKYKKFLIGWQKRGNSLVYDKW